MTDPADRRPRPRWLGPGIALTVLAILAGALAILSPLFLRSEITDSVHNSVPSLLQIDADTLNGLDISPGEPGKISIERTVRWALTRPEITEEWTDGTLRLRVHCPTRIGACDASYTLRIPPTTHLKIRASTAPITVTALTGTLDLTTDTGSIMARDITGPITAKVRTGTIDLTNATSPTTQAEAQVGDLTLHFTNPPQSVHATTTTGNIQIHLPPDTYQLDAQTSTGTPRSTIPHTPDAPRTIHASTTAGNISIDSLP
ncbi:DUF4097 family beta strand repeat-containing protein [Actinocorallia sp. A-T 12471]|uniref:DUF4097 family beta strand repeat-containing protein n=1 Tax=Actinocorallia sp. A-T 12471 TaxID=3089813 RepID=UPI0029CF0AE6|nr:DUF4097 family beta strand repeat-containing protein [Actinocorallia sp. A-T 12471]MDX6741722.1 DUF4097 family beta strand repeat-containing protein [Actinocorallia sp. A-T 12471]